MLPRTLAGAEDTYFLVIGAAGATVVAALWVILGAVKVRLRERTKREIAAYVAEGSISPDDGAKLMRSADAGEAGETELAAAKRPR